MSGPEQCGARDAEGRPCALEAGGHAIHVPEKPGDRARTTLSDLRYARKALHVIVGEVRGALDDAHEGIKGRSLSRLTNIEKCALTALGETEEPTVPYRRAGGGSVCPSCFSRYREHPLDRRPEAMSDTEEPWLRVLCNGERVKL